MKLNLTFKNFYFRNAVAYLLVLAIGLFLLHQYFPSPGSKKMFWASAKYSYMFLWVFFHNRILLSELLIKRKQRLIYILTILAGLYLWLSVSEFTDQQGGFPFMRNEQIVACIMYTIFGTAIFWAAKYIQEKESAYQLNILKRDIELQQLKSQLNPHFLFNALNNIYSYTLNSKKYGNELILKLSELMRFILDTSEADSIKVDEEISFIENYIAFEKERLGKRCIIRFSKNILYGHREIPPFLLFPFVENAFKYGASTIESTEIDIIILDTKEYLKLIVKNSFIDNKRPSTKKGLPNAKRRLELLYPDSHDLKIETNNNIFHVNLILLYE